MTERTMQLRVGFLTLLAIVICVMLVFVFQNPGDYLRKTYELKITFATARGVTAGTPVRNRGVLVGKVASVEFTDTGGVLVTVEIDDHVNIPRNSTCYIKATILGQAELDFLPAVPKDEGDAPDEPPSRRSQRRADEEAGLRQGDEPIQEGRDEEGNHRT